MLFNFRRKEVPWEVVSNKTIEPVAMYYDEDKGMRAPMPNPSQVLMQRVDLDIVSVGDTNTCGTYVFNVKQLKNAADLRNAVVFARQQLLQEVGKRGFNVLLSERLDVPLAFILMLRLSSAGT
jgi:hypothetical protein